MARMFETDFDYNEESYTATVVISGGSDDKTVIVQVPEELKDIVPEGKIIVEHFNETQKPEDGISKDPALVESIMAAVEKHEESKPPLGAGSVWN